MLLKSQAALALLLVSFFTEASAQTASADNNPATSSAVRQVGTISDRFIIESSGVVACGTDTNVFWTHNDGKNPVLYAINRAGESVDQFVIAGITVTDWEDIARDDRGSLYLADIGNNNARRATLAVHRLDEPEPRQSQRVLRPNRSWNLRFPDKPFDCESIFIWRDHGYLISKVFQDEQAAIYRFALTNASSPITLEKVAQLPVTSPVTGADMSPDGTRLGLVCNSGAYIFQIDGDVSRAGQVTPLFAKFREGQIEGCCFVPEGLLAVSEKREIFLFDDGAFREKAGK
jgi:hypothetical protein